MKYPKKKVIIKKEWFQTLSKEGKGLRGLYNKLLELRESKNVSQFFWGSIHKCIGVIDSLTADTISIIQVNSFGEEDGVITIPIALLTHIIEDSQEINQIKQYVLQKSFKI